MNELEPVLHMLKERIRQHRALYEQNEAAVRDQIVKPMLRAIGWDPENPEHVQPNVRTEEGFADYSLLKDGTKRLFVEVKKLAIDVSQRNVMSQLARYSFDEGTEYGVLTNGVVWLLVKSFESGTKLTDRTLWKADLETDAPAVFLRKMATISRENVDTIEALVRQEQMVREAWQSLRGDAHAMARALTPAIRTIIETRNPALVIEDKDLQELLAVAIGETAEAPPEPAEETVELQPSGRSVPERPKRVILPGESHSIKYYYEILVYTAEWLIKKGKLGRSDCPVNYTHRRRLVHTKPEHPDLKFVQGKKLSNGLWVETHFCAADIIRKAQWLLEKFGYPKSTLSLE